MDFLSISGHDASGVPIRGFLSPHFILRLKTAAPSVPMTSQLPGPISSHHSTRGVKKIRPPEGIKPW